MMIVMTVTMNEDDYDEDAAEMMMIRKIEH